MAFHYIRISAFLHNKIGFNTSLTSSLEIYLGWTQIYVYTSFKADLPTICWNGNTNFITIQSFKQFLKHKQSGLSTTCRTQSGIKK